MVNLGDKVRDKGIATARCEYLDGTPSVRVEWCRWSEGKMETAWFEEPRLELVPDEAPKQ